MPFRVGNLLCTGLKIVIRKLSLIFIALYSLTNIYCQFESSYTILDSALYFSFTSEVDSSCDSRLLYQSNEHGLVTVYTDFEPGQEGTVWEPAVRKSYSYDPFGKNDSILEERKDDITGLWEKAFLKTYVSYGDNQVNAWEYYYWDETSESWHGQQKMAQDFDLDGNLVYNVSFTWDIAGSSWVESSMTTWIKNEDGIIFEQTGYTWSVDDSEWKVTSKLEYYFNDMGLDTLRKQYVWDEGEGNLMLINQYRSEYTLDGENRVELNLMYGWGYIDHTWELTAKDTIWYALAGDTIYDEFFILQDNDQWKSTEKTTKVIGADNRIYYFEQYSWNDFEGNFQGSGKFVQDYNNDGQRILEEGYWWDSNAREWVPTIRSINEYHPDGNMHMRTSESWNASLSDWELKFRSYYYYTEVNDLTAPQLSVLTDTVAKYTEVEFITSQDARVYLVPEGTSPDSDLEGYSLGLSDVLSLVPGSISTSSIADSGIYWLYAVNIDGFVSLASKVWITLPLNSVPVKRDFNFRVYPTLVEHSLTIESEQPSGTIELYDLNGRKVKMMRIDQPVLVVDISDLEPGIYCVVSNQQPGFSVLITKL